MGLDGMSLKALESASRLTLLWTLTHEHPEEFPFLPPFKVNQAFK